MSNSKNKINSSNSKKKITNNSKKQTIINAIKTTQSWLIFIFKLILAIIMITKRDIKFSKFLIVILITLIAKPIKNNFIKTPTKVDSQKNIIKLPLSTFKLFLKRMFKIMEPVFSIMNYSIRIIFVIFLVKIVLDVYKIYFPESNAKDNIEIFKYLEDLLKSNETVHKAFNEIPFKSLFESLFEKIKINIQENIQEIDIKKYIYKIASSVSDKALKILNYGGDVFSVPIDFVFTVIFAAITRSLAISYNFLKFLYNTLQSITENIRDDTKSYYDWVNVSPETVVDTLYKNISTNATIATNATNATNATIATIATIATNMPPISTYTRKNNWSRR